MGESYEMSPVEGDRCRRKGCVNTKLLPIKLHFVLSYGALGGLIPYLPLIIKSIGINAAAYGVVSTAIRFTAFLTKPLLGAIADYCKNTLYVLIFVVLGSAVFHSILLLVPPIQANGSKITVDCGGNLSSVELPFSYNFSCMDLRLFPRVVCEMEADVCPPNETDVRANRNISSLICDSSSEKAYLKISLITKNTTVSHDTDEKPLFTLKVLNMNENVSSSAACIIIQNHPITFQCLPKTKSCILLVQDSFIDYIYDTYQFWIVLILAILGGVCFNAIFSLNDAACYEVLKNRPQDYGMQRMYGSAASGVIALLAGQLNDLKTSSGSGSPAYYPGFFIMIALTVLDMILLCTQAGLKTSAPSANHTSSFKDVFLLFTSRRSAGFAAGVLIIGGLFGIFVTYEILFLQTLGASQLLIGVDVLFVSCIVEVPSFFFFSGWVIQKLGCLLCLVMAFAAYSLRYFLYSVLKNPWYVLPIDMLHGLSYCVFLSAMTLFASENAPAGTEATTQGAFSGLFRGLGFGVGSLLGGFAFDKIGGHNTFFWTAVISLICVFVFSILIYLTKAKHTVQSTEILKENTEKASVTR